MRKSSKILSLFMALCVAICSATVPSAQYQSLYAAEKTPYSMHGKLKIKNGLVVDKNNKPFQLKGVSSHGINWDVGYPYVNKASLQTLRDKWGANCFRVAMYTEEYNGYCNTDSNSKKQLLSTIDTAVKSAKSLGMYVIIDWHILSDGNPNNHKKAAKVFFKNMSSKYKKYGNVLYEICNEPNGVPWSKVKSYANYVIPAIRENASNIIIVGTPNWCQDVDIASKSKITGYKNIAYSLHFYAATHKDDYRKKLQIAVNNKLPVICTEFSGCDASGNGGVDETSANAWIKLLDKNHIGYVCWSLSNKNETASLLKPSTKRTSNYKNSDLSQMGKWLVKKYNK